MNILDIIIVLIIALEAVRGAQVGILRSVFSIAGFWIGLLIGGLAAPVFMEATTSPAGKLLFALMAIFGFAILGGSIGRAVGIRLRNFTTRLKLEPVDAALGSVFSAALTLFIIWLLVSTFSGLPSRELNQHIHGSAILSQLDNTLPPAPAILARLAQIIDPTGFPQVFVGPEPQPAEPVDPATAEEIEAALAAASRSTVKLESAGCGGLVFGSGFIAAENLVVTNAHVVAGINRPTVVDENGRHRADTVLFDPDLDIAILRTEGLAGNPLEIFDGRVERGTRAVVLGFPAGGPQQADPAGVRRFLTARGRNIYGGGVTIRPVYELVTEVESGNSGGPLVRPDGTVIGVIFARSELTPDVGYAVSSDAVVPLVEEAQDLQTPVSTGRCATI